MNKVVLLGNLTREPENTVSGNTSITKFSIAVTRKFKKDGVYEPDFFNCTAFGATADFISKHFSKGSRIAICGHLQNNYYTNKDGTKVYSLDIIVEEVDFAEKAATSK